MLSHSVLSSSSATPWTIAHQAPLFMGFPRQTYWSGLPFPFPGDLPDQGLNPGLLYYRQFSAFQADSLLTEPTGKLVYVCVYIYIHTHTYHILPNFMCVHIYIIYMYIYTYTHTKKKKKNTYISDHAVQLTESKFSD